MTLQTPKFHINPLSARTFTVFNSLLEDRVLHKEAWVAKLLGIQVHKKFKFSRRDNSSLAVKGLYKNMKIVKKSQNFYIFS